jgi:hypothetical protein
MSHTCPVCGFAGLEEPPRDHTICECCGTQFGYHDVRSSHAELRRQWIDRGATWHSRSFPAPPDWSAMDQLRRAGFVDVDEAPFEVASAG